MKTKSLTGFPVKRVGGRWRLTGLAALVGFSLPMVASSLDQGLIAYYPFTGNANDASTTGAHGAVQGPVLTSDRYDRPDQAYLFDGFDDYINIGNKVKPDFPITVTAWIYPVTRVGDHMIFRSGTFNSAVPAGSYNGIMLGYNQLGVLYTWIGSGPALQSPTTWCKQMMTTNEGAVVPLSQWTHVAVVWLGWNTMKFYVNGALKPSKYDGAGTGMTIVNSTSDGAIGLRDSTGNPSPWPGKLDEIRVYSRELTTNEILSLAIEPPEVTVQPLAVTTNAGATVVFTATAIGAPPLAYRWQFEGTDISGANSSVLTLSNLRTVDTGTYRVIVSNAAGTNSALATLTVTETSGAVSTMPALFTNGTPFTVAIRVVPPEGTFAYALEDQPLAGWPVSQISDSGTSSGGKVSWFFPDGAMRDVTYVVTPPSGATGTNSFAGMVSFNGTDNRPITGVRQCHSETVHLSIGIISFLGNPRAVVTLTGRPGRAYDMLATEGLELTSQWRTNATNLTLGASVTSTNWLDLTPLSSTRRFYRARAH